VGGGVVVAEDAAHANGAENGAAAVVVAEDAAHANGAAANKLI